MNLVSVLLGVVLLLDAGDLKGGSEAVAMVAGRRDVVGGLVRLLYLLGEDLLSSS